jgi:hypothetical protein
MTEVKQPKRYSTPRLEVYGSVHQITDAAGMMSLTADGAAHGMTKTS